ncbi:hypothetical protein [Histophilus somni]|uniref:hypothetical protein n=1 Tax=Histophilus somni TaxID=731 RepID=UPI0011C2504C|nr:hypothetical protein [Histophilus somni]QEH18409.1 hypothetical protein FWK48_07535 [Histophilus somni]
MKNIIYFFCLFLSSCALVPLYSITSSDAKWVHRVTGEDVSTEILVRCSDYASLSIIGRRPDHNIVIDREYINNLDKINRIKGKCLYENGFIFKVKMFSVYCYRLEEVCNAYNEYRK